MDTTHLKDILSTHKPKPSVCRLQVVQCLATSCDVQSVEWPSPQAYLPHVSLSCEHKCLQPIVRSWYLDNQTGRFVMLPCCIQTILPHNINHPLLYLMPHNINHPLLYLMSKVHVSHFKNVLWILNSCNSTNHEWQSCQDFMYIMVAMVMCVHGTVLPCVLPWLLLLD